MKRILFLFLPFLPYLATAQVAKDTVTVLTLADIPAGAIRDTTNFTFVQDNAFKKATFDSLYKYTRVKLLSLGAITSAELATALSNETGTGAAVFGTNPTITGATISGGSINNTPIGASTANTGAFTTLTTTSTINSITVGRGAGALSTNTALGQNALAANTTANFNTAIGNNALQLNTTGGTNTAIGSNALKDNTTGAGNVAIGSSALRDNQSGGSNMAIGVSALLNNTTGNNNVAIGASALTANTVGTANMAIGLLALSDNTIGENNTAIGANALDATTGSNNTAIGRSAGANITSGGANLILGNSVDAPSATASNQVVIKNIIFATGASGTGTDIAGNVGIGVNNPQARLHVLGTMKFSNGQPNQTLDIIPAPLIGGTNVNRIATINTTGLSFETGALERMRILSGGNVNIGGDYSQTSYRMSVYGGANVVKFESSSNTAAWQNFKAGTTGPSWSFGALDVQDNEKGLFFYNNNHAAIDPASAYRVVFANNGNVGIGTDRLSTTANFQVRQTTTGSGTVSVTTGSPTVTGSGTQFLNTFKVGDDITVAGDNNATPAIPAQTGTISAIANNTSLTVSSSFTTTRTNVAYTLTGGTRFAVKGNGNVGIGIDNPITTLDIRNATGNAIIRVSGAAGDNNGASLRFTTPGGTGTFFSFGDRGSLFGGATGQTASLFTTANVPFTFDVGQSQRAVITANGLFGINQATPDERLHVNGTIKAASTNATNLIVDGTNTNGWGTNMALRSETTNFAFIGSVGSLLGNTTKDLTLWSTSGNGARIYTNGNNLRLIVESGGDVGIGTNDAVYRLDVNGNFRADSIFTDIAGNAVFSTSDARLKKNIEPVSSMLQKITALNPVTYEWNDLKIDQAINRENTAHLYGKKIGLIAQEVYEVFPDFVGTDADGNMVLSYGAFIVPMLKAIQEQQQQIEALKARITQLENK